MADYKDKKKKKKKKKTKEARVLFNAFCNQHMMNCQNYIFVGICTGNIELINYAYGLSSQNDLLQASYDVDLFFPFTSPSSSSSSSICWDDWTPLHLAAYHGKVEVARVLLEEHHAEVNAHSVNIHSSPLLLAIAKGHHEMMRLLLDHEADANDTSGRIMEKVLTPMMLAVTRNDVTACRLLLESSCLDVDVNFYHQSMTNSYLGEACLQDDDDDEIADMLIAAGADIKECQGGGGGGGGGFQSDPVYICLVKNKLVLFERLIQARAAAAAAATAAAADPDSIDYHLTFQTSFLFEIIFRRKSTFLEVILEVLNPKSLSNIQKTSLANVAILQNEIECLKVIIRYGASVNPGLNYSPPLHSAVLMGHTEIVKYLIEEGGADANATVHVFQLPPNNHALMGLQSPLSIACAVNRIDIAQYLISAANGVVDLRQSNHNLCLMNLPFMETLNETLGFLQSLILQGRMPIDISCLCHFETRSLVDMAICEGLYETVNVLLAHGTIPDWLCHDNSHYGLIGSFPLGLIENLLVSGACLRDKRESERRVTRLLWRDLFQRGGGGGGGGGEGEESSSSPMTLEKLTLQAARTALRNNRPCHQKSVWFDIDELDCCPPHLKDLLKMKYIC